MLFGRSKKHTRASSSPFQQPTVQQLYPNDKEVQKIATQARAGDPEANYRMGLHHLEGNKRDVVLAVIYLREAARVGHLQARFQIAAALIHGFDDPSGLGRSFSLFCSVLALNIRSFNGNDPWVTDEINAGGLTFAFLNCMAKIFNKQEHEAVAMLITQASEHGSMLAMGALGYCHAEGKGVPQNYVEAYIWFNLAAAVGLRAAAEDRDRFADKMSAEQLVQAQRKATDMFTSLFGPAASASA
jgi:uncharacterized protein